MVGTLIELTLGELVSRNMMFEQSFNNDSQIDRVRNSFHDEIPEFKFYDGEQDNKIPPQYLYPNVHKYESDEIYKFENKIVIGEYCNNGVIVPRKYTIAFNKLFNCSPLISLIKGEKEFLSFLHTWAVYDNPDVVDRQVKYWMDTIARKGDIMETIFAPRKGNRFGSDTKFKYAIDEMTKRSQKTILLTRNVCEIIGSVNTQGVYFKNCGYHLWSN